MVENIGPFRPRTRIGMAGDRPVEATWEFVRWLEQLRASSIVGETGATSLQLPLAAYAPAGGGGLGSGVASYARPEGGGVTASYATPAGLPIPFPIYT